MFEFENSVHFEKVLQLILNHPDFPKGVYTCDMNLIITSLNPALVRILDYPDEKALLNKHIGHVIPPPYKNFSPETKKMKSIFWQKGFTFEISQMVKNGGSIIPVLILAIGLWDEEKLKPAGVYAEVLSLEEVYWPKEFAHYFLKQLQPVLSILENLQKVSIKTPLPATFSDKQLSVMVKLAEGKQTKEIATETGLSEGTVDNYRSFIRKRLKIKRNQSLRKSLQEFDLPKV